MDDPYEPKLNFDIRAILSYELNHANFEALIMYSINESKKPNFHFFNFQVWILHFHFNNHFHNQDEVLKSVPTTKKR